MTDHFAVFGVEPEPLPDEEKLKEAFHRQGALAHPDREGGSEEQFRELNNAWQTLRDPARRIRHLLELRAPDLTQSQQVVEPGLAELFLRAGACLQEFAGLQRRDAAADSPLVKALLAGEKMEKIEQLGTLRSEAEAGLSTTLAEVSKLGFHWESPDGLRTLAALQRRLAFYGKWARDLGEAMGKLQF